MKHKKLSDAMKGNSNAAKGNASGKQYQFRLYPEQIAKIEQWKASGINVSERIRQLIDESGAE